MRSRLFLLLMLVAGVLQAENALLPFAEGEWKIDAASRVATVSSGGSEFTVVFQVTADLTGRPIQQRSKGFYVNGLEVNSESQIRSGALLWRFQFTNPTSGELCFEPSLRISMPNGEGEFWDGYETRNLKAAPFNRSILLNTYPAACILLDSIGLGFGLTPSPKTSYLESGVTADRIAYYATRIALPPKQSCEITFVVFPFRGAYQQFDAMNRYQELFPEAFAYTPGVDERLVNGQFSSSHYEGILTGSINSPIKVKYCGQGRVGMSWSYTYYRKQGDFYGHAECWDDLSPATPQRLAGRKYKSENELEVDDRLGMHRDRNARFRANDFRANTLNGIYIFNTIDKDVIKREHFEKYVYPLMKGQSPYQGWALGYDLSGHLFAWASPMEAVYKRDIPPLLAENEMSAISYDGFIDIDRPTSIGQNEVYRGKLDYYLPGWSYDNKGHFIRNSRYIQEQCDYFHSLKKNGRTLGVWSNVWFANPLIAFKPDAYLYENFDPTRLYGEMYEMFVRGLYFRGNRPAYIHNIDYETQLSRYLSWEKMTPHQLRLAAEDYVRDEIALFYQANLMPVWKLILSHRDIYAEMPFLTELSERGFYPPCPVRGDGNLDKVRYGKGLNGLLVLTNRDRQKVTITQHIDNPYFGDFSVVPFWYRGGMALHSQLRGKETTFSCEAGIRENVLISTPVALRTAKDAVIDVVSHMTNDPYEKVLVCTLVSDQTTTAEVFFQADAHFTLFRAKWDGGEIVSGSKVDLTAGKPAEFRLVQRSEILRQPLEELMQFPFSRAMVVIPEDADERLRGCAQMVEDNLLCGLDNVGVSTVTEMPAGGQPAIVLVMGEDGVWLDKGNLIVSGSDSFRIQQEMWHVLRLMDRHYPGVSISWMQIMETDEFRGRMENGHQTPFAIMNPEEAVDWKNFLKNSGETTATVPFGYSTEVSVPLTATAPVIDGDLGDSVWTMAAVIEDFRVVNTQESSKLKTRVQLLHDVDNLYFAIRCHETRMEQLVDNFTEHDSPLWEGDDFEIRLAPGIDAEEKSPYPFYMFAFSPSGVKAEQLNVAHTVGDRNARRVLGEAWENAVIGAEWDGAWKVATYKEANGWNAEVVIPLQSIGLTPGAPIRLHLGRGAKTLAEDSCWPLVINGSFNTSESFGSIDWQE